MSTVHRDLRENARMNDYQDEHEFSVSEEKKAKKAELIFNETVKSAKRNIAWQEEAMWNSHRAETELSEDEKNRQIEESFASLPPEDSLEEENLVADYDEDYETDEEVVSDNSEKYSGSSRSQRRHNTKKAQSSQKKVADLAGRSVQKMFNDGSASNRELTDAAKKAARLVRDAKRS